MPQVETIKSCPFWLLKQRGSDLQKLGILSRSPGLVFTVAVVLLPAQGSEEDFYLWGHSGPDAWRMTQELFERGRG